MMTPFCYYYQNPSGFEKKAVVVLNLTEVSNLSVKGKGI